MTLLKLDKRHLAQFRDLMALFANVFEDDSYSINKPSDDYALHLLNQKNIIHLVAQDNKKIIGGLVAYVLEKFEQQRSEVYIYDLAVAPNFRRQGVATKLINNLKHKVKKMGAWVIFVQADEGDLPAIKLYQSMGREEKVLHFDIEV